MNGEFRLVDGVSCADVAFEIKGDTIQDIFFAASHAVLSIMLVNPDAVKGSIRREIVLTADSYEMLLYDYINELLVLKDAERLLMVPRWIKVSGNGGFTMTCNALCHRIDPAVHEFKVDIKAVTMHGLVFERAGKGWRAFVVVDV